MDQNRNCGPRGETPPCGFYATFPDGSKAVNFTTPPQSDFDTDEMRGSMQQTLARNIGEYVVIEFLIGTERLVRKQGVLHHVGVSYVTIYDEQLRNFIICDIFSVKFVYFYFPGERPKHNYNILPNTNNSPPSNTR